MLWVNSATIADPVSLTFGKEVESLPSGTTLPEVLLVKGAGTRAERVAYCTPSRVKQKVKGSLLGGNLVGILMSKIENSFKDSQKCLEDRDGDGKFDHTFMVGEGPGDLTDGADIAPVPYARQSLAPVGANDYVTLTGGVITKKRIWLRLALLQDGKETFFDAVRDGPFFAEKTSEYRIDRDLGWEQQIYGIRFKIKSADPATKTMEIEWPESAPKDASPIIPVDMRARY